MIYVLISNINERFLEFQGSYCSTPRSQSPRIYPMFWDADNKEHVFNVVIQNNSLKTCLGTYVRSIYRLDSINSCDFHMLCRPFFIVVICLIVYCLILTKQYLIVYLVSFSRHFFLY